MSDCTTLATKAELLELEDKILNLLKQKIDKSDRAGIVHDGANAGEKLVGSLLGFGTVTLAGATLNGNQQFLASLQQQVTYTKTTLAANTQATQAEINKLSTYAAQQNVALQNNINQKANLDEIKSLQDKLDYDKNQYVKDLNQIKSVLNEKTSKAELIAKGKEILAKQELDKANLEYSIKDTNANLNSAKSELTNTSKVATEAASTAKNAEGLAAKAEKGVGALGKALQKLAPLLALLNLVGFAADIINVLSVWTFIDSLNKQIESLEKTIYSIDNQLTSLYSIAAGLKSQIALHKSQLDSTIEVASAAQLAAGYAQNTANGALDNAIIAQNQAANANSNAMAAKAAADQAYAIANQASIELQNLQTKVKEQFKAIESDIQGLQVNQTLTLAQFIALKGKIGQLELTISSLTQKLSNSATYLKVATQAAKQAISMAKQAIDLAEKAGSVTGGGGASVALNGEIADLKNKLNQFEGKFAEDHKLLYQTTTTVQEQLKGNITEKTTKYVDQKITQSKQEYQKLNEEQVKQIQQSLKEQSIDPKLFAPLLAIPAIDALLKKQDSQLKTIANNTKGGKTKCLAPIYVPPVQATASANLQATNILQGVTITQNGFIQKSVNGVTNVVNTVNTKLGTPIANGGIGGAISRLYNFLAIDRWLNMLNTALLFHNALMLSRSLTETAVSAIGSALNFAGIKFTNAEGEEQELSSVINHNIEEFAKHILGAENYTELTSNWKKANRIYQAATNILYTVRGMIDTVRDLGELAINNTGRIGNALRRAGAIFDREGRFPEEAKPASKFQKIFDNYEEATEGAENIFSTVDTVTSELISLKDEKKELKEQKDEFQKALSDWDEKAKTENDIAKSISASTPIESKDLIKPNN